MTAADPLTEVFDLMTKWIERYRRLAEERYRRLDDVLHSMPNETGRGRPDGAAEKGEAG